MIWRDHLPARVALATAGLLALLLLLVSGAAYAVTAWTLRQAVDGALASTLAAAAARPDLQAEALARRDPEPEHEDGDEDDDRPQRHFQVTENGGAIQFGPARLPADAATLAEVARRGYAYRSLVEDDGRFVARTGPDWWQMLMPRETELRVLYATGGAGGQARAPVLLQLAAPMGVAGQVLPALLRWLAGLVVVGSALACAIAWRMAAATYRPLTAITATAEDISTRTLGLRIPDVWRDRTLRHLIGVLNAMIARLQGAFEAQGRFVAAAAHELRGPLAAMRVALEVTLRRERSPAEYREALQVALAETARLTALSEHLLVLARYERGAALAMERNVPLAPLLERTAREVARTTGGQVVVEAAPDLLVDGDPLALERLVANLARNGVQAGGAPVTVTAAAGDGGVWLHVRDQGRGIDPRALPHIFEPFYRADSARSKDGGTGLGLAIVKTIIEAHQGKIDVQSRPGEGTAFHVWLPRRQEGEVTPCARAPESP